MTLLDFCAGASLIGIIILCGIFAVMIIRAPYDPYDE
jgi:hypothetical protein